MAVLKKLNPKRTWVKQSADLVPASILVIGSQRSSRPEAVFYKKAFLKISHNSLEKNCARVSYEKRALLKTLLRNLLTKILWNRCFRVNFMKYLRTSIFPD